MTFIFCFKFLSPCEKFHQETRQIGCYQGPLLMRWMTDGHWDSGKVEYTNDINGGDNAADRKLVGSKALRLWTLLSDNYLTHCCKDTLKWAGNHTVSNNWNLCQKYVTPAGFQREDHVRMRAVCSFKGAAFHNSIASIDRSLKWLWHNKWPCCAAFVCPPKC